MVEWEWNRSQVGPAEVLDAARTMSAKKDRVNADLTTTWADAGRYLAWATAALSRGGDDGWDAAAGWAKRAVCRRMDGILVNNHLGRFVGQNNEKKAGYLARL